MDRSRFVEQRADLTGQRARFAGQRGYFTGQRRHFFGQHANLTGQRRRFTENIHSIAAACASYPQNLTVKRAWTRVVLGWVTTGKSSSCYFFAHGEMYK